MEPLTPAPSTTWRRRAAIAGSALATKAGLAILETRLTIHLYGIAAGIVAANTGLTVALLKLLP